jgi:hypothetical protein
MLEIMMHSHAQPRKSSVIASRSRHTAFLFTVALLIAAWGIPDAT